MILVRVMRNWRAVRGGGVEEWRKDNQEYIECGRGKVGRLRKGDIMKSWEW